MPGSYETDAPARHISAWFLKSNVSMSQYLEWTQDVIRWQNQGAQGRGGKPSKDAQIPEGRWGTETG